MEGKGKGKGYLGHLLSHLHHRGVELGELNEVVHHLHDLCRFRHRPRYLCHSYYLY